MTTYVIRNGKLVDKKTKLAPSIPGGLPLMSSVTLWTRPVTWLRESFIRPNQLSGLTPKLQAVSELGNDSSLYKPRKPVVMDRAKRREDIKRSIYDIRNGRVPQHDR